MSLRTSCIHVRSSVVIPFSSFLLKVLVTPLQKCIARDGATVPLSLRKLSPSLWELSAYRPRTSNKGPLVLVSRILCSKVNSKYDQQKLQDRISLTLCHLENIFPPSFFNIIEHLPIHLAEEALLVGLVQYRWMYLIERYLLTLKIYVHNRARLEGCIAKGALMEECMTFCARRHLRSLKKLAPRERQRIHNKEFSSWFRVDVLKQGAEKKVLTTEVIDMAMGLTNMAKRYNGYVVNGFRFRTKRMDNSRVTQNSDVVVIASTTSFSSRKDKNPMSMELTYYGKLTDIIEVHYTDETKFVLFKCNWVDNMTGVKVDNFGITLVNFSHLLYMDNNQTDEPFILTSQAEQVMYVEDPIKPEWEVTIKMTSRDTFDMGEDGNSN
ncbi:hypothetical protein Tco_0088940 [Tanacetum coccineum]